MSKNIVTISDISNYDNVLSRQKKELLEKATLPTIGAYTNPNGADIQALNKNIRILAFTKCQISKDNLEFVLLADRSGVSLRLTNFSIKNLSGIGAEVKFETTGRYNYQEQFTISFNVYSEYLGLELSNPRMVYQDRRLQANKAIESFDIKCVKKTSGLLDWQYKSCNYTLSIVEPFYFLIGGRKTNSLRVSSNLDYNTTFNVCLAEISDAIVGQELTPVVTIEGNGSTSRFLLSSFKLAYFDLSVNSGQLVYKESKLTINKVIIDFNVKCKKEPEGLQDWQYLPCSHSLKVEKPFSFLTNTGVIDNVRVLADFGLDSTYHLCLTEINDKIVGKVLSPDMTIKCNHNADRSQKLIGFELEYSGLGITNISGINLNPIIGDTESIESFDVVFKGKTPNLRPWQYIENECELRVNPPFCFKESKSDLMKVRSVYSLHKTLHMCLWPKTEPKYIGMELTPTITISAKDVNESVELEHPVVILPKPGPGIKIELVPTLSPFRITDITKDNQRIGSLRVTNTCDNPLGNDLIISKIDSSNKCISTEEAVYSPIKPGNSAIVTNLLYKALSFKDLTEEPYTVNCTINVVSNAEVKNAEFKKVSITLIVTDDTPIGNQNEIIIPIIPLPRLNVDIKDTVTCFDSEGEKEVDLSISHWHDKPRKNVYFSLEDKMGVASLEENSFPEIAPNIDNKSQLILDTTKLTIGKPTQVVVSATADYTYKVSKTVTIIKSPKEEAKLRIENLSGSIYSIYANGKEYSVATFDVVNATQSSSVVEAESADITSLHVEMTENEKTGYSAFFRIVKPKELLKPQERAKCTVFLKIEREKFDKDSDYFSYRPVCDNQINYEEAQYQTLSMSINRQQPVEKSEIRFEPERNNGYDPKDNILLIGTIVLHEKRENPDPERYYDRVKEGIGIVDKDFFFMNEEGVESDDLQTFGIEKKKLKLYWKVLGRENVFKDIPLPIHYYCENVPEDNDKLISEVYE